MSGGAGSPERIERRFRALRAAGRAGLITFVTAGDPEPAASQAILDGLAGAGADLIELGMPFSDPMADGPAIQASSLRALKGGQHMYVTLDMVHAFRRKDSDTPIVLMGYYNPIYSYGVERFVADAASAGVDGLIVVDLPPEESAELTGPARARGLDFIRLATPTTDDRRLPTVLADAGGFIYYVSIAGITGTRSAAAADIEGAIYRLRRHTDLPIAVGFGIRTPEQAKSVARVADAAVVGSALVDAVGTNIGNGGDPVAGVLDLVRGLAAGVRAARDGTRS